MVKIIHQVDTELRKKEKNDFENYFFKLVNNSVSNVLKLVTKEKIKNMWHRNQIITQQSFFQKI